MLQSFSVCKHFSIKAEAADLVYEGCWVCLNTALNNPVKNISRSITKVNDTDFKSILKNSYTVMDQIFILNGDYLLQKDSPSHGLMIKDEKLQTIDLVDGKVAIPTLGQIVCDKVK